MNVFRFIPMLVAGLFVTPAWAQVLAPDTLAAHNSERQNYPGVGPLQWSPELEQYAQSWANSLAIRNAFQHRPSTKDNPLAPGQAVGENLFAGYGTPFTGPDAVGDWIAEKQWYRSDHDNGYGGSKSAARLYAAGQ